MLLMNYLVTGGTGMIGKALINSLHHIENNISILTRSNKTSIKDSDESNIKFINKISLSDIDIADVVINLAGEPIAGKRWTQKQKYTICQSRWQLTEQIAGLIKQSKSPPSLFISGSAIGIYGRQDNKTIDESFIDYHDEFTHYLCSTWESLALSAQSELTRVVSLRTGIVLGLDGGALKEMLLPFKLGLGGKMGTGKQMMSWIHIDDMVSAIIHIKNNKELSGPINMTTKNAVTNEEFSQTFAQSLRRPCLLSTPSIVVKCLFGEMSDVLLFGQNVKPSKLLTSGFTFKYPDLRVALDNLFNK
jgi:hypothetical protein